MFHNFKNTVLDSAQTLVRRQATSSEDLYV